MENLLSQLQLVDNGAKWYKVDLHLHTPTSHDYKDRSIPYNAIVGKTLSKGLDMIAITDHNTGYGYKKMCEAARGTQLVVLPGVEIIVEGIHILAVFPEKDTATDITYLLHNLKIKDEDMGKKETISSVELSIPRVLEEVDRAGGIPIIAHTDSTKGLTKEIRGVWRAQLVRHKSLKVVEITKDETKDFFDGSDPSYRRKLSCIKGSDAHHPDEIGQRATWIKMGECNFRGLKQIIHEPDLRISLREPVADHYPRIIGMDVSGGLYESEIFHFNMNLNCVIGGRGAGKSAVIDFIRFGADCPPRSREYLREFNERIVKLLGVGNCVRLCVGNTEGVFLIERKLTDFAVERISGKEERVTEISSEERIYQIVNNQLVEEPRPLWEIFEMEVFGQGEVFELTRRADDQLKLIDEYIGAEELFTQEETYMEHLKTSANGIIDLQKEERSLSEKLGELKELKEEIRKLQSQLKADVFKQHNLWEAEKSYFDETKKSLDSEKQDIESRIEETIVPELPPIDDKSPNIKKLNEVSVLFQSLFKNLDGLRRNELVVLKNVYKKIGTIFDGWKEKFDAEDEKFRSKLAELGVTTQQAMVRQLVRLRQREFELEKRIKPQHDKISKKLEESLDGRCVLLASIQETRKAIQERRAKVVKQMSRELEKGDVKIEINPSANRRHFFELLDEVYTGSDMYKRKEQLEKICSCVTPLELVGYVREGNKTRLVEAVGITEDSANKIIGTPRPEALFEIETCPLQDELVVYLKKAKGEDFSPLKDLSYGEKCTAIFSIALLGKTKPLLVDQPEDELDHAFVIKNIVEHIRGVKEKRQLLISTHNANIPVLGDAELIFKVAKVAEVMRCEVEERGAFEKASIIDRLQDLEGGPEAFRRRREKYGI